MTPMTAPIRIVVADDDADDRLLVSDAFEESALCNPVDFVEDGVELLEYLRREGRFEHLKSAAYPGLILLDLNMPRMDGRAAAKEIRSNPELSRIPIVVLTTSRADEDIVQSYGLGVNSYISKPITFDDLVGIVKTLGQYWFEVVTLPPECTAAPR